MTSSEKTTQPTALVLHAGAIGDVVLGTLVPAEIKRARPELEVIYWTHESLVDLLRLCPSIDSFIVWNKRKPLLEQAGIVRGANAQMFVDLSSSLRTRLISLFSGTKTWRYHKQSASERPIVHAAENFRQTVADIVNPHALVTFPTLVVPAGEQETLRREKNVVPGAVALVPGVGSLRSHRAWAPQRWAELARQLNDQGKEIILIGGPDDREVATAVESAAGSGVTNMVGMLSLRETAVAMSLCSLAVSGDTGPSHIAVAVGTPVVGLLGPTYPERSGPYGYVDSCLNAGHQCRCHSAKTCLVTGVPGPGECMSSISVEAVYEKVRSFCLENSWQ
jgi:ADP-heptose:LPS heptosyltransferase